MNLMTLTRTEAAEGRAVAARRVAHVIRTTPPTAPFVASGRRVIGASNSKCVSGDGASAGPYPATASGLCGKLHQGVPCRTAGSIGHTLVFLCE